MINKIKQFLPLATLFIFVSLLVFDQFIKKGIFTAHDIETSIIYFGSFFESLSEGNIFPRWSANIANLYGSPTSMFFYPFSFYIASIFRLFDLSLIDSMKIYVIGSFLLSSLFMYLFLRRHFSVLSSFAGSFLYVYAPYRINDIYARGSVAENTSFMLFPLTLVFLNNLLQEKTARNLALFSLCIAAMILSHPFMLIVFSPLYIGYIFYLGINSQKIKMLLIAGILSFGLSSFYVTPLVLENKYTHYDVSPFNGQFYYEQFLSPQKLVIPQWTFIDSKGKLEYQTYQLGLLQITVLLLTIGIFAYSKLVGKVSRKHKNIFIIGFISTSISVFLMLPASDIVYKLFTPLKRIEFPWRFLALNLTATSLLSGVALELIKNKKLKIIFLICIIIGGITLYLPYSKGHDYKVVSDNYYLYQIRENTDAFATLPRWAAQPDSYERINKRYKVLEGNVSLTTLERKSTRHIYAINASESSRLADKTFYFPGWQVLVDGKKADIQFQDPQERGIITFNVPAKSSYIEVEFKNTKVRALADLITLVSLVSLGILLLI